MAATATAINLNAAVSFSLMKANTGFANTTVQQTPISYNWQTTGTATPNQAYAITFTLAAGAHNEFDLSSFTDLAGNAAGFGHIFSIFGICPSTNPGTFTLAPGSSNGITNWYLDSTGVTINPGAAEMHAEPVTGAGIAISGTNKTIRVTNNGASSGSITVIAFGSNP